MYAPHLRITAIGTLGTVEAFSYGVCLAGEGTLPSPTAPANADLMNDFVADLQAFHASTAVKIAAQAVLRTVKVAMIGADGKYVEDPFISAALNTAGGGGVTTSCVPQTALAVSLETDRRGATGRGRFYLPMANHGFDDTNTFLMSIAKAQATADAAASLLNALNDQPGVDQSPSLRVVVASTKGYNTPVTGVRVGRALDTIRSRRRSLAESYVDAASAVVN